MEGRTTAPGVHELAGSGRNLGGSRPAGTMTFLARLRPADMKYLPVHRFKSWKLGLLLFLWFPVKKHWHCGVVLLSWKIRIQKLTNASHTNKHSTASTLAAYSHRSIIGAQHTPSMTKI
jgi:hypothetical protein